MGWAKFAMERLLEGQEVTVRPHGGSMRGKVESGDEVKLAPCDPGELALGDIVLVRVKGNLFLHLIKAFEGERVLIGNNVGGVNGWTSRRNVFGVAVEVAGRPVKRARSR